MRHAGHCKFCVARYQWVVLIAPIYQAFPPLCTLCAEQVCLIAFITEDGRIEGAAKVRYLASCG